LEEVLLGFGFVLVYGVVRVFPALCVLGPKLCRMLGRMKYFFCHIPFGRKEVYAEEVMKANLERLSHLIKVCGFLLQTKVYLFWKNLNV